MSDSAQMLAESVEHMHAAMLFDFRLLVAVITLQTVLLVWLILSRRP